MTKRVPLSVDGTSTFSAPAHPAFGDLEQIVVSEQAKAAAGRTAGIVAERRRNNALLLCAVVVTLLLLLPLSAFLFGRAPSGHEASRPAADTIQTGSH
jgi:hypothetical protein